MNTDNAMNEIYEAVIIEGTQVDWDTCSLLQDAVTKALIVRIFTGSYCIELSFDTFESAYAVCMALVNDGGNHSVTLIDEDEE